MKTTCLIVLTGFGLCDAFSVKREPGMKMKASSPSKFVQNEKHITYTPFEGYQSVDIKRAKECAENFGVCSVKEMEFIKSSKYF